MLLLYQGYLNARSAQLPIDEPENTVHAKHTHVQEDEENKTVKTKKTQFFFHLVAKVPL